MGKLVRRVGDADSVDNSVGDRDSAVATVGDKVGDKIGIPSGESEAMLGYRLGTASTPKGGSLVGGALGYSGIVSLAGEIEGFSDEASISSGS